MVFIPVSALIGGDMRIYVLEMVVYALFAPLAPIAFAVPLVQHCIDDERRRVHYLVEFSA